MEIIDAINTDIKEVLKLGNDVDEFNVSEQVVTFWPKTVLENLIASSSDVFLVAKHEGKIVGFIIVNSSIAFEKAIIENIYVGPEFRGRGIAKALLREALRKLEHNGCKYVCTLVDEEAAIKFYTSNGFGKGESFVWLDKVISDDFRKT